MKRKNVFGISAILLMLIASCAARPANNMNNSTRPVNNTAAVKAPEPSATPPANKPATDPGPVVQVNKDPKTLTLAFYEYYVDGFPNINDEGPTFALHLTGRFFREASNAEDYDPFLDAQDFDNTWKGNVSVSDAVIKGNKATVDVLLNGETFKWTRRVSLVKQRGVWKIDGVKGLREE